MSVALLHGWRTLPSLEEHNATGYRSNYHTRAVLNGTFRRKINQMETITLSIMLAGLITVFTVDARQKRRAFIQKQRRDQ